eukprot:GDKH01029194.1.p3 GENE.GDKH01029194.1~~GDKH01029194.1.p3  ORF type:complete len:104 (-),score=3.50 GDKH01029194.1:174-485(-)
MRRRALSSRFRHLAAMLASLQSHLASPLADARHAPHLVSSQIRPHITPKYIALRPLAGTFQGNSGAAVRPTPRCDSAAVKQRQPTASTSANTRAGDKFSGLHS